MQESHTSLAAGQRVLVRDEPWIVVGSEIFDAIRIVHVRGTGDANFGCERSFLAPFDAVDRIGASTRLRHVCRHRALSSSAAAIAGAGTWSQPWTAAAARIDLRDWQLEPAVAAIAGATRILLADAVGLGKTIQALLIVSELLARGLAERVLVLTPPSLRHQWAAEMRERFSLPVTVLDQASLKDAVASLPPDVNPWDAVPVAIASLDLVKRPDVRAAIDNASFDILIVDEVHHAAPGTDRGAVVADLAARTPWVVMLSATPHSGDEAAFAFLTSLGAADGGALRTFERSMRPAGRLPRRSRMRAVTPTDEERAMLTAVDAYARALRHVRRHADGAALLASVIARRAASSAAAVERTLLRRIALLSGEPHVEEQALLPWDEGDADDESSSDVLLATSGLGDVTAEVRWLQDLAALAARAAVRPSKVGFVRRLLRRTTEPLLVFSEYRDVVQIVVTALADSMSVAALHGGLSERERRETIAAFNSGRIRVLVATDAAGEGLNLHQRCRVVLNMELPWMPRRLEQRIGRVDRLGQTRRVHAIHLVHRNSFESTVIARLDRRRDLLRAKVANTSIDDTPGPPNVARRLLALAGPPAPARGGGLFATRRSDGGEVSALVLLFSAHLLDARDRLVTRLFVPVRVVLGTSRARHAPTRRDLRTLLAHRRLSAVVHRELQKQSVSFCADTSGIRTALAARLEACLRAAARRAGPAWQGSLFDHRAELQACAHDRAIRRMRDRLERTRQTVAALNALRVAGVDFVAAWPAD